MAFCGLIKGISPKICILSVRVKINKRSFEPFCVLFRDWQKDDTGRKNDDKNKAGRKTCVFAVVIWQCPRQWLSQLRCSVLEKEKKSKQE